MRLLNIESSPRGSRSASIAVSSAFLEAYRQTCPGVTVDTLNVWEEKLPDFDHEAIGANPENRIGSSNPAVSFSLARAPNTVSFSSACTTKRFPSSRCASAIQIVRPSESSSDEPVRGQKHTLIKRCSQAASAITA